MSISITKTALPRNVGCFEPTFSNCNVILASSANSSISWKRRTGYYTQKASRKAEFPTIRAYLNSPSEKWREVHGQTDWNNMLHPIDPFLRSEVIRYGEMTQACYDAFEYETFSKNCGNCRFVPNNFFDSLGLSQSGYEITRYIYATCDMKLPGFFKKSVFHDRWSATANWIGYVAVSDDNMSANLGRRDIIICWRGTVTKIELLADLMDFLQPVKSCNIPAPDNEVKVESGFLFVYTGKYQICPFSEYSPREQVLAEVKWLLEKYADEELSITITGHSLGSALAILNAYDIAETGMDIKRDGKAVPICVFSFAGPRVGNMRFKERLESLDVKVLRLVNVHDKVPKIPGVIFNENVPLVLQKLGQISFMSHWCYTHVGVEIALDHKDSPFLKETSDFSCFHNLETYLHLLNGYQGDGRRFELGGGRDIAMVNKSADFLKNSLLVPPNWLQRENRGMILDDGHWRMFQGPYLRKHVKDMNSHIQELF